MYINNYIISEKLKRKSRIKYNNIIKNSDEFPNFLSTKHFYKRRKISQINTSSNLNVKKEKIVPKLPIEKIINNKFEKHNSKSLGTKRRKSILDNNKNYKNLFINTKNDDENNIKNIKKNNALTLSEKIRLKTIIKNFENNKITTNSLYNQEKKFPLNSVTENNYFFLFSNYKKKKNKTELNKSKNKSKISKSALISYKMMKKFNHRTNKILESDKSEETKYSNNINEFRKQIINSYKDSVILKDISKRKINYDNAMKLLESANEKRIENALELEKEFYKKKYCENQYFYENMSFANDSKKRKSKKLPTAIARKINGKISLFSSPTKPPDNNLKNKYSFKSISGLHKIHNSLNGDNNISNLFTKTETSKIYEHNNPSHLLKKKISKSHQNSNKKKLSNKSILNNNENKNQDKIANNKSFTNNFNKSIFLNYVNSFRPHKIEHKALDYLEKKLLDTKEDYKKYIKKEIKQRSKQFADSFASINNYYEYQPLIDMNSDMPELNVNSNNLKRVIKINNIKKNLFSIDDDDLLMQNIKKLKEKVREVEMDFYTVDGNKKKYHLSFIKNEVKPQTIVKFNIMKNPHFGIPC